MALATENKKLRDFLDTSQGKSYTLAVVTAALVLVIFIGGIYPAVSSILFQIQENSNRRAVLAQIEIKRNTLEQLNELERNKHAVSLALNAALPNGLDQREVLRNVNELASESGVQLLKVSFAEIPENILLEDDIFALSEALKVSELKMSVGGSRTQLEGFLVLLEESRRIIDLKEILILNPDSENSTEIFKMDITTYLYHWDNDLYETQNLLNAATEQLQTDN